MEDIKGLPSFTMMILSLLSRIIDIPNHPELLSEEKPIAENVQDDSSFVKYNIFTEISSIGRKILQWSTKCSEDSIEAIFGKPLPKNIPLKLVHLMRFLMQNLHIEGIFRINGSCKRVNDLKKLLDAHGNVVDWEKQDVFTVHDAANVLKTYLSELPVPLLGEKHMELHISIAKLTDSDKKLEAVQLLLHLLPEHFRVFLNTILVLLSDTARNAANHMSAHNLGLIFSPHLLKSPQMDKATGMCLANTTTSDEFDDLVAYTAYLIENAEKVFECPENLKDAAEKYRDRLLLGENPEDIPIEISSVSHQVPAQEAADLIRAETKSALINLYQDMQDMPESKEKNKRIRKFEKHYPQLVMEVNNCSHSPMVRTKSTRRIGHSISKVLNSYIGASPAVSNSSRINASFSTPNPKLLTSTPVITASSQNKVSSKRKAIEMLQDSPDLPAEGCSVSMETEEPKAVRRKLNTEDDDGLKGCIENNENDERSANVLGEYRELGETYREYFV